ncbi:aminoglycoside phosphotransferase family protein [Modestobacter versicolor]|uniref:Aminoglycoside phosphotransferase (APT) family kinase protein n=1 Tax=Modestobacter versicolor TaxID=429133 RepID=A0A839Y5N7_9ACTN|nr:aminoglycoside phosphotransferase family protein [Modestobacter versicolor]MBB3678009.1 aminoglycoside phosphotransferase (APT) family kinase protein [Modestobacter versicolor]
MQIDVPLVRRLVRAQFPEWGQLPVRPVTSSGWDNRTFRLGEEMLVRLPSAEGYAAAVGKEQRWLPHLARHLPLPVPVPLAQGAPGQGYPWSWSVYRWLDGEDARTAAVTDLTAFAADVAAFLTALQQVDASGGPPPGPHSWWRGAPLAHYDAETRRAIDVLSDVVDRAAVTAVWDRALATTWERPPRWFHGDVAAGNLLVRDGRLAAVLDFGTSGVGDPACDLVIAWTLFDGGSRTAFRGGLALDPETWARGRGWALWKALLLRAAMTGTADRSDPEAVIAAVLADA